MVTDQVPLVTPLQVVQDRFRIVRFLGKGGAGTVYEATDLKLRRRVALRTRVDEAGGELGRAGVLAGQPGEPRLE